MTEQAPNGRQWTAVFIACPECGTSIAVPIAADLDRDDEGRQVLVCTPEMADLWAHVWTHEEAP